MFGQVVAIETATAITTGSKAPTVYGRSRRRPPVSGFRVRIVPLRIGETLANPGPHRCRPRSGNAHVGKGGWGANTMGGFTHEVEGSRTVVDRDKRHSRRPNRIQRGRNARSTQRRSETSSIERPGLSHRYRSLVLGTAARRGRGGRPVLRPVARVTPMRQRTSDLHHRPGGRRRRAIDPFSPSRRFRRSAHGRLEPVRLNQP